MLSTTLTLLALLPLLPLTLAQYGAPDAPSSTTAKAAASSSPTSGGGTTHIVEVGKDGSLTFSPDTLAVPVGDSVEFRFYPSSHSVVQSTFQAPCVPASGSALFSGFMPVASGVGQNSWTVKINDTGSIWLYCSKGKHCQMGMAAVINPPSGKTLDAYKLAAVNVNASISPDAPQGGVIGPLSASSSSSAKPTSSASIEALGGAGKFVLVMAMAVAAFML